MTEPSHSYSLLLPFDTDDPEFVRGFEAGRVWAEAGNEAGTYTATVHTSNAEMMLRIADALERPVRSEELGDGWLTVTFA